MVVNSEITITVKNFNKITFVTFRNLTKILWMLTVGNGEAAKQFVLYELHKIIINEMGYLQKIFRSILLKINIPG